MLIVRVQGSREPGSLLVRGLYMLMVSWMRGRFIPLLRCFAHCSYYLGAACPYVCASHFSYKFNMSVEEAAELARRAIYHATFRDGASGGCVSGIFLILRSIYPDNCFRILYITLFRISVYLCCYTG